MSRMGKSLLFGALWVTGAGSVHAAPPEPSAPPLPVRASTDVTDVALRRASNPSDGWEVVIKTSRPVAFTGRALPDGHRFYVDFPDCRLSVGPSLLILKRDGVTVRAAQFSVDPAIVRVVAQSDSGPLASLKSAAPASEVVLQAPAPPAGHATQVEIVSTSRKAPAGTWMPVPVAAAPSKPRVSRIRRSRSTSTSRGGGVNRPAPEALTVFHPDAMEAYDDPPVPSEGGSLAPVMAAVLPETLKQGAERALMGNHRYVWGGDTPNGFDCSGMMQFIYRYAGMKLPRVAADQYEAGSPVNSEDLQPGDLLFFSNGKRIFHVGMYLGDGRMFHAANPKRGLTTDLLSSRFYADHFAGARRFLPQG